MLTGSGYLESLSRLHPTIYLNGQKVEAFYEHPLIEPGINVASLTYDLAFEAEFRGLMTATSHLDGSLINRFCHIYQDQEDLLARLRMIRMCCQKTGGCIQRCTGADALNALSVVTFEVDQKYGTTYHDRFLRYLKYCQQNDLYCAGAVTDVKGDRSLYPHQQEDPDVYVHIVEKGNEGIVVRGAKAHTSGAPYSHELIVLPTRALTEDDRLFAVAFAIPIDADGVTLICDSTASFFKDREAHPITSRYGVVHSLTVFDNVFVPWERVFLCEEWEFAGRLANVFANYHRFSYCGCKPAMADILTGAAALIAEYNGVEGASHVKEKLVELAIMAETIHACGIAAAVRSQKSASGTCVPDAIYSNIGKYHAGGAPYHEYMLVHDIAGGMAANVPSCENSKHPLIGEYIAKYLKGRKGTPANERIQCFRLIKDMTTSGFGGMTLVGALHGGGSPMAERIAVRQHLALEEKKKLARELAGIKTG